MTDNAIRTPQPAPDARELWETPAIETMRVGDAELGATPLIPEGPFGSGS